MIASTIMDGLCLQVLRLQAAEGTQRELFDFLSREYLHSAHDDRNLKPAFTSINVFVDRRTFQGLQRALDRHWGQEGGTAMPMISPHEFRHKSAQMTRRFSLFGGNLPTKAQSLELVQLQSIR